MKLYKPSGVSNMKSKRLEQIKKNDAVIAKAKRAGKPTMIIVLGVQGCGKGTQSEMYLAEHATKVDYVGSRTVHYMNDINTPIEVKYIGTGNVLRSLPDDSPERKAIDRGNFVPDSVIINLLKETITTDTHVWGDGLGRNFNQAKQLVKSYKNRFNIVAVHFDMPAELVAARIEQRISTGAARADDTDKKAVQKRVGTFNKVTMPAIGWLRVRPDVVFVRVPITNDEPAVNYARFKTLLNEKLKQNNITL